MDTNDQFEKFINEQVPVDLPDLPPTGVMEGAMADTLYDRAVTFFHRKLREEEGIDITTATILPLEMLDKLQHIRYAIMMGLPPQLQQVAYHLGVQPPLVQSWITLFSGTSIMLIYMELRGWLNEWLDSEAQRGHDSA